MLKGKNLLKYTNLFSPNDQKSNNKIILKCFQQSLNNSKWCKSIVIFAINK